MLTDTPEGRAIFLADMVTRRADKKRTSRIAAVVKWRKANPEKVRAADRRRYAENPQKNLSANRAWRAANRDTVRDIDLRYRFGITLAERNAMLQSQGGKCAVCPATTPGPKDWHTDHCHKTGTIRGILCNSCNTGIGHLKDSVETLKSAINYLEHHSSLTPESNYDG